MAHNKFAQIRESRKVPAYRNRIVTYRGRSYRIANVIGSGLLLRWQVLVHPIDPDLKYDDGEESVDVKEMQRKIRNYAQFVNRIERISANIEGGGWIAVIKAIDEVRSLNNDQ